MVQLLQLKHLLVKDVKLLFSIDVACVYNVFWLSPLQWTVGELKAAACEQLGLPEAEYNIWDYFQHDKYKMLEDDLGHHLEEEKILDSQAILLDSKVRAMWQLQSPWCAAYGLSWTTWLRVVSRVQVLDECCMKAKGDSPVRLHSSTCSGRAWCGPQCSSGMQANQAP